MKKATQSLVFSVVLVLCFACSKNKSEPTQPVPIDPVKVFLGNYEFIDTCLTIHSDEPIVIVTDTIMPGQDSTFQVDFQDTLIIEGLEYEVTISKKTDEERKVIISNFQDSEKDIIAEITEEGGLKIPRGTSFGPYLIDGIGSLDKDELILNFTKEDVNGLSNRCKILGKKQ